MRLLCSSNCGLILESLSNLRASRGEQSEQQIDLSSLIDEAQVATCLELTPGEPSGDNKWLTRALGRISGRSLRDELDVSLWGISLAARCKQLSVNGWGAQLAVASGWSSVNRWRWISGSSEWIQPV